MERPPESTTSEIDSASPPPSGGGCGCAAPGGRGPGGNGVAVVGVRLRGQVRLTQFNSRDLDLELGDRVLIEADRGTDLGEVVQATTRARRTCSISCMRSVVRVASAEDIRMYDEMRAVEESADAWCRARIRQRSLPMRLVRVDQSLESHKLTFQFTAEGRVDFR